MIYRQTLLAEQILSNYRGISNAEAWDNMRLLPGNGPWKGYETNRIKSRLLLEDYDRNRDPLLLRDLLPNARQAAESPYSNFEDYFYAGVAEIYSGNNERAEALFLKAEQEWPVKDLIYGLNSMFLTSCMAIRNDSAALERIEQFKEDFPDWLYSEIYLPEFEQMSQTYPRSALLPACHGRVLSMTYNDARAAKQYQKALAHQQLPPDARKILRIWQQELQLQRKKEGGS